MGSEAKVALVTSIGRASTLRSPIATCPFVEGSAHLDALAVQAVHLEVVVPLTLVLTGVLRAFAFVLLV